MTEDQTEKIRFYFEQGNQPAVRKEMERAGLDSIDIVTSSNKIIEIRLAPPPDPGITAVDKGKAGE